MNKIKQFAAAQNISVAELARRIGVEPHTLRRYTRAGGAEPKPSLAQKISKELGVRLEEVMGMDFPVTAPQDKKLPLYGAAQAGLGAQIIDIANPIDQIDAPSFISNVTDAYAVYIVGDAMMPRFNAGEVVFVHPHRPVKNGSDVVVQLNVNDQRHAFVLEYVSASDTKLIAKQHNPDKQITFDSVNIHAVHSVIGSYFG